jgi:DNA-nicking Smr family endonuclease
MVSALQPQEALIMKGRNRKRVLSREELELWAHVTRRDAPLVRSRAAASAGAASVRGNQAAMSPKPPQEPAAAPRPSKLLRAPANRKSAAPPQPEPFDARAAKRIARGRREIGARLDLHGMRQEDAYAALRRFLTRCQAEGHRHVLIITGKGGSAESGVERDLWSTEERGVLRRLVPHWLGEPSFRLHIVSFTESALKHGGSGALYVTIRKGPRAVQAAGSDY